MIFEDEKIKKKRKSKIIKIGCKFSDKHENYRQRFEQI